MEELLIHLHLLRWIRHISIIVNDQEIYIAPNRVGWIAFNTKKNYDGEAHHFRKPMGKNLSYEKIIQLLEEIR